MQDLVIFLYHTYYIPVSQVEPENRSGHDVHRFSSLTSQAVHVPPQAENIMQIAGVNYCISKIFIYYYIPVEHVGPENPSGQPVHMVSSLTSQAIHGLTQAEQDHTVE